MADKNTTGVTYGPLMHESVWIPVPTPNAEDLKRIPLGVHMLLVNMTEEGVMFMGAKWSEHDRTLWLMQLLDEETGRFENSTLFYVDPDRLAAPDLPVRPAEEIVEEVLREWTPRGSAKDDIDGILLSAITKAREGMTVNPF